MQKHSFGAGESGAVVADQWQHRGIAHRLMSALIDAARSRGLKVMQGEVLSNNHNMLKLMNKLEFHASLSEEDPTLTLVSKAL